jgi:outer membrane protein OmpA-like peptidoglycan-associated protein
MIGVLRFIISTLCVLVFFELSAQNIIPNAGFEGAWSCPENFTEEPIKELVPYWKNPNRGTPDYFHRCSDIAGIPSNFAGYADAPEGDAYIGLILRERFTDSLDTKRASREYVEVELFEALEYRQLYCFNLKYRLATKSKYSVDALGVAFTREKMKSWNFGLLTAEPMVFNLPGHIMNNKDEWVELCGVFRSRGKETILTIGNFVPNFNTHFFENTDSLTDSTFTYAYYYIDDLKLYKIENEFECGCLDTNSVGYDWMADDPKSFWDYYNEYQNKLNQEKLLALNQSSENNKNSKENAESNGNELQHNNNEKSLSNQNNINNPLNKSNNQSGNNIENKQNKGENLSDSNGFDSEQNQDNHQDMKENDNSSIKELNDSDTKDSTQINSNKDSKDNLSKDNSQSSEYPHLERNGLSGVTNPYTKISNEKTQEILNQILDAKTGFSIDLPNIYFAFNQSELLPSSYPSLEILSNILKEQATLTIEIRGHTDNIGNSRYNKKLSIDRAESVYQFLIESGINKTRLKYRGFGNEVPVADNATEFGRQLNRRVEIKVITN